MYCVTAHIRIFRWTHTGFVHQRYYSKNHNNKSDTWMQDVDDLTHSSILRWKEWEYLHMYYAVVLSTDQMFCWWSGGSWPALRDWIAGSSLLAEQTASFLQDQSVFKLHPATGCLYINQILCFHLPLTTMSLWTWCLFIFPVFTLYFFSVMNDFAF